jgi:hypothetical protein
VDAVHSPSRDLFAPTFPLRHVRVGREPNLVAFDVGDEAFVDEVVMALVAAFAAVLLRQLDAAAFDLVDRADMDAIDPDDFHKFFDFLHW